jgi:hypothetical protein
MKRLFLSFTVFVICLAGIGQAPSSFNYQFIVHRVSDEILPASAISCKISILAGSIYDTAVYSEKHNVRTNTLGLVTLAIGNGTDKTGSLSSINWSAGNYFLKIEIDTGSGINYKNISTTQILSVPVTLSSNTADSTSPNVVTDQIFINRKYAGTFLDYRQTGPKNFYGPNLIWIKTSLEKTFGKISAYSKKCAFSVGDRLYLRRIYYVPGGISGYWVYQIENDSSINYRMTEYQYDHKVPVETWFK